MQRHEELDDGQHDQELLRRALGDFRETYGKHLVRFPVCRGYAVRAVASIVSVGRRMSGVGA
jgi:hypothetical protein